MSELRIRNLTVSIAGHAVISDISFTLHACEGIAVLGESGCGKSTLAHAIAGMLPPSAVLTGEMQFGGQSLLHASGANLRGGFIGLLRQAGRCGLNPVRRVGDQLVDVAERFGRRDQVAEAMGLADLPENLSSRYAHELSGGERQRVCVAALLLCNPALVILDEPFNGLDQARRAKILKPLLVLIAKGSSLLLVTHDWRDVPALCGRTAIMHEGRMVELAGTGAVMRAPTSEAARRLHAAQERVFRDGD